jgi:tetratricopeptide (TPR) repeat protein
MALNPRNSHTRAYLGLLIAFSGEWERGLALVQRAMALNPHFPDWCYLPYFYNHYRKGEYETALQVVKRINMPEDPWPQKGDCHGLWPAQSQRNGARRHRIGA